MPQTDLNRVSEDFRTLADRFDRFALEAVKPAHLSVNINQSAVRGGRLLVDAIDGGAFPKSRSETNGGWWDRSVGRVPGHVLTVLGAVSWREGEPPPHEQSEYRTQADSNWSDEQYERCWMFAIGSWLQRRFPSRFRQNAGGWDWKDIATDAKGHPIGKDAKPLHGHWYRNGERLPDDFKLTADRPPGEYKWRLEGQAAGVTDFYDEADWLAHLRVRAEVYADACKLLARLVRGQSDTEGPQVDEWTVTEAAEKYGVLKSVWSKAANKSPEEPGFLPTRKVGRNRFVSKAKAKEFADNYDARREQRVVGTRSKDPDRGIVVSALKAAKKKAKPRTKRKSS